MRFLWLFFSATLFYMASACSSMPVSDSSPSLPIPNSSPDLPDSHSAEKISEVSLTASTGHLGSGFTIALRRDQAARIECRFYKLNENDKPKIENPEPRCGELYRRYSSDFVKVETTPRNLVLQGVFTGSLPKEQFDELARLVIKNDFLSMDDRYLNTGTHVPPDNTSVIYAGKMKRVANNSDEGGEKLSEIKRMIYALADKPEWTSQKHESRDIDLERGKSEEFIFRGTKDKPLKIICALIETVEKVYRADQLISFRVLKLNGEEVMKVRVDGGQLENKLSFTPPSTEDYILNVTSFGAKGKYRISFEGEE